MSARPTNQLPSFTLVLNQAIFSEVFVTVYWQDVSHNQPQPTDNAPAAAPAPTLVPPQPQPAAPVAPLATVVPVNTAAPTRPSHIRRVRSVIERAFDRIIDRLRPGRDV